MTTNVVVAGWGQITQPRNIKTQADDPMGLMAKAAAEAAACLKASRSLSDVDGILVVKSLSTHYTRPADALAARIGAAPAFRFESRIGGNSPQTLINRAAGMIARGELKMALVAGAEAYVPRTGDGIKPDSALLQGIPGNYDGDDASGVTPVEAGYGIEHPMQGFPLFETALWAASGKPIDTYLREVAEFWSDFSRIASRHPYAWTRRPRTPEEIITPSPRNRPIAFPYTKFMNAFVTVDQGAAVILMSEACARRYGAARGNTVFFHGGGYAEDRQRYLFQKTDFTASPPLKAAVDKAVLRSGIGLDAIDVFDLYSCFPCAVSIGRKMLGLAATDPRPLSLTGGLGFFGGPGNNYNLHAVATLCGMIADGRVTTGLTTALGWFMHKHAAGIYSALPPENSLASMDVEDREDYLAGPEPLEIHPAPSGNGVIETYTVVYNRDREPAYAVIYGRTENGRRFIANTRQDPKIYRIISSRSMVGKTVTLSTDVRTGLTVAELRP